MLDHVNLERMGVPTVTFVTEPFDFDTAVVTALRHCAPDVVVCLGPGNSLGGPLARLLVWEGWRGLATREAFDAADPPALLAFGVTAQRKSLV